jgi:hypothetical protein
MGAFIARRKGRGRAGDVMGKEIKPLQFPRLKFKRV